ncbi:hypothetical protein F4777DRAFT_372946 [Nemania sp. FL0916]|nr:hypothetical protein F4777DRAFT_372946 [Nemania sp. FL0916]
MIVHSTSTDFDSALASAHRAFNAPTVLSISPELRHSIRQIHHCSILHINASKMTPSTTRLLARSISKSSPTSLPLRPNHQSISRAFSQTCRRQEEDRRPPPAFRPQSSLLSALASSRVPRTGRPPPPRPDGAPLDRDALQQANRILATDTMSRALGGHGGGEFEQMDEATAAELGRMGNEPFHFHIFTHKHNTHITVTKPNRDAIISCSAGNIGFKKGKRGTYDAAYQLCAYVLDKLNQGGWHRKIKSLEVVLRGFGQGREACTKILLGNEGRLLRPFINRVSDATRLKFGGVRSKKPRRLG